MFGDNSRVINKFQSEDKYVNGICVTGVCSNNLQEMNNIIKELPYNTNQYNELIKNVDSVYIKSDIEKHYDLILEALNNNKHVLCESPICEDVQKTKELLKLAKEKNLILMEAIKTAYSTAYSRLILLVKAGKIGNVLSIDAVCTDMSQSEKEGNVFKSFDNWGPTALLPIFQLLGTDYKDYRIISHFTDEEKKQDSFTKIDFIYENATASIKVAEGAKSEGELIITGTNGYIYVPAPWWKTDYFEIRYEDASLNKRFFYQLDGEGLRYELVAFAKSVLSKEKSDSIDEKVSLAISDMTMKLYNKKKLIEI